MTRVGEILGAAGLAPRSLVEVRPGVEDAFVAMVHQDEGRGGAA